MSAQNTVNIGKKIIHHHMSRAGYEGEIEKLRQAAIAAGDKTAEDPNWMPDRSNLFVSGHTPSSGVVSEEIRTVIDTIVSTHTYIYTYFINL